jgi:hypothetical protein
MSPTSYHLLYPALYFYNLWRMVPPDFQMLNELSLIGDAKMHGFFAFCKCQAQENENILAKPGHCIRWRMASGKRAPQDQ